MLDCCCYCAVSLGLSISSSCNWHIFTELPRGSSLAAHCVLDAKAVFKPKPEEINQMPFIDVSRLFQSIKYLVYVWKCLFFYINEDKHTSSSVCLFREPCKGVGRRTKAFKTGEKSENCGGIVAPGWHTLNNLWISILYFLKVKQTTAQIYKIQRKCASFSVGLDQAWKQKSELLMACYWWICALGWVCVGALRNPAWEQHMSLKGDRGYENMVDPAISPT